MTPRKTETRLALLTLTGVSVYLPFETWHSLTSGLSQPSYVITLLGMLLLVWGALVSLRSQPALAPGILGTGYAWTAAHTWLLTVNRVDALSREVETQGSVGMVWLTAAFTIAVTLGLAVSLLLIVELQRKTLQTPRKQHLNHC